MKQSRIARPIAAVAPPAARSLPLVELLVETKAELFELMVRSGLRVLDAMLEEDRTALCGPRYAHQPARAASRAGTVPGDVVLGGRKVAVPRPRVRADGHEVPAADVPGPGAHRPVESARRRAQAGGRRDPPVCAESGTPAGRRGEPRHEQKQRQPTVRGEDHGAASDMAICTVGRPRPCGVAPRRRAHRGALPRGGPRGPRRMAKNTRWACGEGATENAAVCQSLLANLQSRGLRTDRSLLVMLDGAQGAAQSHSRGLRRGRPHAAMPGPQAPQHPRPPAGAPAPMGPGRSCGAPIRRAT